MNNVKLAFGMASVAIVIAVGAYFFPQAPEALKAAEVTFSAVGTRFPNGLTIGTNGTQIATVKTGACTIWVPSTTILGSTTQQIVCQSATDGSLVSGLTGVTTDSICNLHHASSTNATVNGLVVSGVSASSTAGSIVAQLSNLTGATFTWTSAGTSSSQWNYMCVDPL